MTTAPRSPPASGSFCAIAAADSRSTLKVPIRFTRMTVSNGWGCWGPFLPTVRSAQPMPAHETAKRIAPNASTARSTAARTSSSFVTSALKPTPPSSPASACAFSPSRSAIATRAPFSVSSRAVAAPRPDAPPATSAPIPSSSMAAGPYPLGDVLMLVQLLVEPLGDPAVLVLGVVAVGAECERGGAGGDQQQESDEDAPLIHVAPDDARESDSPNSPSG